MTDADNTLWDTNAQYKRAQLVLLSRIEAISKRRCVEVDRLAFVRQIDQQIAIESSLGLRYPPRKLADALLRKLLGGGRRSLSGLNNTGVERAVREYVNTLRGVPRLRRGVRQAFEELRCRRIPIIVLTEGGLDRVSSLLEKTSLRAAATTVVCKRKNAKVFSDIRLGWPFGTNAVAVGDQLDRDILPAIDAGFVAVHFPSAFVPMWVNDEAKSQEVVAIHDYREILLFLGFR